MLVIPFADGIGDFVMMLPLLDAVRRRYPAAAISVVASERSRPLLDASWETVRVRTPSWLRERPGPRGGPLRRLVPQAFLAALAPGLLRLELGRYDRTLNLFYWWERGMKFAAHWTPQVPLHRGAVHSVDHLADRLGAALGQTIPAAQRTPVVRPRPAAARWAAGWWKEVALDGRPVVALAPATNMAVKRWPIAHWAGLADTLFEMGCQPLLMLPPGRDPAERIPALARHPIVESRAPLDRVAALLARCALVVGVDTGLLHIAAAVGARYVGLFGPTNPHVTGPYDRSIGTALVAPFVKQPTCAGCWRQFKYIDDRCETLTTGSCMHALPLETVVDACIVELGALRVPTV